MGGKAARSKGRRGESAAKMLLTSRDWAVHDLTAGLATADLIAVDPHGKTWCVEVKATSSIAVVAHRRQAMEQGKRARLPWMLMSMVQGTGVWLVQRQGFDPVIWKHACASVSQTALDECQASSDTMHDECLTETRS